MLWTLSVTLSVLWLLGMVSSYTLGGFIHVCLLMSAALAIAARASRKRAFGNDHQPANVSSDSRKATPKPSEVRPAQAGRTIVPPKSPTMFLSYRRDDSADVVGRIYDRLVQQFGDSNVFKDVDSIRLGVDFREHLQTAVGECQVLIAVIGPAWADVVDHRGARRLDDDRDYVRIEIEAALNRKIAVIPVLVRGAVLPREDQLPGNLAPLAFRNGIAVRTDPDFHRDMDRLIAGLQKLLSGRD